jgi:hypothetical protein
MADGCKDKRKHEKNKIKVESSAVTHGEINI